jgi:hypothetical protein
MRRIDHQFGMVGAQMLRHRAGMVGLVEILVGEADREGLHRLRRLRLHQCHDGGRIYAPGQKRAQRHIGQHAAFDGVFEQIVQIVQLLRLRPRVAVAHAVARDLPQVPEAGQRLGAIRVHAQDMAGRQFLHALIDRARRRHIAVAQIARQCGAIQLRLPVRVGGQRLQLRAEQQRRTLRGILLGPVDRLDAEPVAHQPDFALLAVPQRKGEHADEARDSFFHAPGDAGLQQHFGIRCATEVNSRKIARHIGGVEDLAVVADDETFIGAQHRLRAGFGQVDNGEAAMTQRQAGAGIDPVGIAIGSAIGDGIGHRLDLPCQQVGGGSAPGQEAGNAAHGNWYPVRRPDLCLGEAGGEVKLRIAYMPNCSATRR